MQRPKEVEIGLDLKFFSIKGTWRPNDAERRAAWELYVELITRIGVVPLQDGMVREALTSLYSLFGATREILRRYGPEVAEPKRDGEYNFGYLAVAMLNFVLRPLLSYWHPAMQSWEAQRAEEVPLGEHEAAWQRIPELRDEIERTRQDLLQYASMLAEACGIPDLSTAVPRAADRAIGAS